MNYNIEFAPASRRHSFDSCRTYIVDDDFSQLFRRKYKKVVPKRVVKGFFVSRELPIFVVVK